MDHCVDLCLSVIRALARERIVIQDVSLVRECETMVVVMSVAALRRAPGEPLVGDEAGELYQRLRRIFPEFVDFEYRIDAEEGALRWRKVGSIRVPAADMELLGTWGEEDPMLDMIRESA